jgi:3-phosphoshikimate 1-carboxyvinyltransferase
MSKIVVSVSGADLNLCVKALEGAEHAEFRTDLCLIRPHEVHELMKRCPWWIVTLRNESLLIADIREIFAESLKHHPIYVDVDVTIVNNSLVAQMIGQARDSGAKIMISYHHFEETPDDDELVKLTHSMFELCADVIKLACMAHSVQDGKRMTALYQRFPNIIAFGMGDFGRQSRIDSLKYGLKIAFAAPDHGKQTAEGQYRLGELKTIAESGSLVLHPFSLSGVMKANPSKSCVQRALALALLAEGQTIITNCGDSEDVTAVKSMICALGAVLEEKDETCLISPASLNLKNEIVLNVGESALALRMFAPLVSLFSQPVSLNGSGTLLSRPLEPLLELLHAAGILFEAGQGQLPLRILGPVASPKINADGSFSSQMISGLLMCLPLLPFDSVLELRNAVSKSYIELTLELMRLFGAEITVESKTVFHARGRQKYLGIQYHNEGDWSGAANFLVAAAVSGEVQIEGLDRNSKQADRAVIDVLKMFGASVIFDEKGVSVKKKECHPFSADVTDCPDLVPVLAVLASAARGTSVLDGVGRLVHKESDRVKSVVAMISSLGGNISVMGDRMMIYGKGKLAGGVVRGMNDHRIVMAASVAACICEKAVTVTDVNAVNKSFPLYFDVLRDIMMVR